MCCLVFSVLMILVVLNILINIMVTNKSDARGFITIGPVDGTVATILNETTLDGFTTLNGDVLFTGSASFINPISASFINPITAPAKYEVYQSGGSQIFNGDDIHYLFRIDGGISSINEGLHLWNTSSYTFRPTQLGKVYTFRVDGVLSASAGNPFFHLDFAYTGELLVGSSSANREISLQRQSFEVAVVKGTGLDHSHFHATFLCFSDARMIASGAQFYGAIDTDKDVTFKSCSMMIFEH